MAERYRRAAKGGLEGLGSRLVTEGLGVAAGFGVAGLTGYTIESKFKAGVTPSSPGSDKFLAAAYNNVPKVAIWLGMKMKEPADVRDLAGEAWVDAEKGVVGSVGIDLVLRALNHGAPPDMSTGKKVLSQADNQRLIQENSALRTELNKAMQRLSDWNRGMQPQQGQVSQYINPVRSQTIPPVPPIMAEGPADKRQREYDFMNTPPVVQEREKRYGFMDNVAPPAVQERERKYGFMEDKEKDIAAMFGML